VAEAEVLHRLLLLLLLLDFLAVWIILDVVFRCERMVEVAVAEEEVPAPTPT